MVCITNRRLCLASAGVLISLKPLPAGCHNNLDDRDLFGRDVSHGDALHGFDIMYHVSIWMGGGAASPKEPPPSLSVQRVSIWGRGTRPKSPVMQHNDRTGGLTPDRILCKQQSILRGQGGWQTFGFDGTDTVLGLGALPLCVGYYLFCDIPRFPTEQLQIEKRGKLLSRNRFRAPRMYVFVWL